MAATGEGTDNGFKRSTSKLSVSMALGAPSRSIKIGTALGVE
jgi:hypothetical protein